MDRYNRNKLIKEIGEAGQKKLEQSKVLVCGCGGLGSTVITNLASMGIGTIGIVDFDDIEVSNLNRQYLHSPENIGNKKVLSAANWIKHYNPEIDVRVFDLMLDNKNYKSVTDDFDLIIDCFDSYKSKFLLNEIAIKTEKTLIHGGISEFYGQVTVIKKGETPCLRCILPDAEVDTLFSKGTISPAVSTIASIQSMEAAKNILSTGEPLKNVLLTYNGLSSEFKKLKISKNSDCPLCS